MKNKKNESLEDLFNSLFGSSSLFGLMNLRGSYFEESLREMSYENGKSSFPKDDDENFHKTEEVTETDTHSIKKEMWTSIDGTQSFQRTTSKSKKTDNSLSLEKLKELRDEAVSEHRYEDAAKYRDQLLKLEKGE